MHAFTRFVQRLGHQQWFADLGRRLVPLDKALHKLTGGKVDVSRSLGFRTLLLTTTGRKSGQPRTVPLLFARHGDAIVVTASNWGQQHHPAWSANLLATPAATVEVGGRAHEVTARLVTGAEREEIWGVVTKAWPAYDTYAARASSREIRVFLLERR